MDNRKYDQDELLIRQALEDQYPQDFDITKGVEAKMKPRRILRKGLVMAIVAASLLIATVSAAYHIGAFDRLTNVIGQERADELTPLEIRNVQAQQHNDTIIAEVYKYDDIAIELVAIEVFDDTAYIYITLQDLVANRLDEDFFIIHFVSQADTIENSIGGTGSPEIIHRDANGLVTLRSRFCHSHSLEGVELIYTIREIRFGDFYHPLQKMNIDLADFAKEATTTLLQLDSPALGANAEDIANRYAGQIMGEGLPVLTPHNLDMEFGLNRIHTRISSIGVVDGRLHIQVFNPDMRESHVNLWLFHKNYEDNLGDDDIFGRHTPDLFFAQFRVDDDGTLYRGITGVDTHLEYVYDIDLNIIHKYFLAITASGSERVCVNWTVTFNIND